MSKIRSDNTRWQPSLYHQDSHRERILAAYYRELSHYQPFQTDVFRLNAEIETVLARSTPVEPAEGDGANSKAVYNPWNDPLPDPIDTHIEIFTHGLSEDGRRLLMAAADRWHLPKRTGFVDLWLMVRTPVSEVLGHLPVAKMREIPSGAINIGETFFLYDPSLRSHQWLIGEAQRIAEQVKQEILQQGKNIEEHGKTFRAYGPMPPHYAAAQLERHALRLFRALVLDWTDKKIATEEESSNPDSSTSPQAIHRFIKRYVQLLDLPDRSSAPK